MCEAAERRRTGVALLERGLLVGAHDEFTQWLRLVGESGDPDQVIPPLNALATVASRRKDWEAAAGYLERALALTQLPDAPDLERVKTYLNLLNLSTHTGHLDEALQWAGRVAGLMADHDHPSA